MQTRPRRGPRLPTPLPGSRWRCRRRGWCARRCTRSCARRSSLRPARRARVHPLLEFRSINLVVLVKVRSVPSLDQVPGGLGGFFLGDDAVLVLVVVGQDSICRQASRSTSAAGSATGSATGSCASGGTRRWASGGRRRCTWSTRSRGGSGICGLHGTSSQQRGNNKQHRIQLLHENPHQQVGYGSPAAVSTCAFENHGV